MEGAETTTGPAVALVVAVEVITVVAAPVANTVVVAEAEAIIVAVVAVATLAVAVAEVITAAAVALEVTSVAAVVAEISAAVVVVEISVAPVVAATLAEVEEISKEAEVTSMGVAVTSEAAEETSGVAVVASTVVLEASSATKTTSTLATVEADRPILSKDRKDTTIKIMKADHSRNTAIDLGITTTGKTTTAGINEAECAVEAEEAHVEATLAGHQEMEAVCMVTSHPAAARTMTTTIASLQKSSKAVACAAEVTCV